MSPNDKTTTPSSRDNIKPNNSPSSQGNESPPASSTPKIKIEQGEEDHKANDNGGFYEHPLIYDELTFGPDGRYAGLPPAPPAVVKPEQRTTASSTPAGSSSPKIKAEPAEDDYDMIKEEDLPSDSEPEMMNHSDAHEEAEQVSKDSVPNPDELDQNGKAFGLGGTQPVQRSLAEMNADFHRKKEALLEKMKKAKARAENKGNETGKGEALDDVKDETEKGGMGEF